MSAVEASINEGDPLSQSSVNSSCAISRRSAPPSLEHIPRTLRWKIQLNIFGLPPELDVVLDEMNIRTYNESRKVDQQGRVETLMTKHMWKNSPLELIESLNISDTSNQDTGSSILDVVQDPLSAFAREQQSEEQRQKPSISKQSNGWKEFYSNREMIDLIYKDLNRLSPRLLFLNEDEQLGADLDKELDLDISKKRQIFLKEQQQRRNDRLRILADILFCYAKEHPEVGYRQGMHEVLAHVLLALELDYSNEQEEENLRHEDITANTTPLIQSEKSMLILCDAYLLFEAWMEGLKFAYSDSSEALGNHILQLTYAANSDVHKILTAVKEDMGAPPQLYCAKWIRLLFSREISHYQDVLLLWDEFLNILYNPKDYLWNTPALSQRLVSKTNTINITSDILTLLDLVESAACSMILMQRKILLSKVTTAKSNDTIALHECLGLLMNYPCMDDTSDFKRMILRVARYIAETRLGIKSAYVTTSPNKATSTTASSVVTSQQQYHPQQTITNRMQEQDINASSFVNNFTNSFGGNLIKADPIISRVGTFLGGVKATAQNVMATIDEQLLIQSQQRAEGATRHQQHQNQYLVARNPNYTPHRTTTNYNDITIIESDNETEKRSKKRQEQLQQLAQSMEADITVIKNYILLASNCTVAEQATLPIGCPPQLDVESIDLTPSSVSKNSSSMNPKEVLRAIEGLERAQRALVLYGSKC